MLGQADFSAVFRAQFGYVWHALRRLGVAASDLEDVAQQVFMAVYAHLDEFDGDLPLRPWLFGFALRTASNYRRLARHRMQAASEVFEIVDPAGSVDDRLVAREELQLAELALQKVELDRRAMLILHEVEGNSVPQIAEALGLPLNTAYSRLRLARQDFQAAYRRLSAQRGRP